MTLSSMGESMAAQHIVAVDWFRLRQRWDDEFSVSLEFLLLDHSANPRDEPICSSFVRLDYVSLNFMQGGIDSEARKRIMELESRICELQRA